MRKPKKSSKKNEIAFKVITQTRTDFFARGKHLAVKLDAREEITPGKTISFEDPKDLVKFLSQNKLNLLSAIRTTPATISHLAHKLHRSRAAIARDVQLLEAVGIVKSEYVVNPGHGRYRLIKAVNRHVIKLQVEAII